MLARVPHEPTVTRGQRDPVTPGHELPSAEGERWVGLGRSASCECLVKPPRRYVHAGAVTQARPLGNQKPGVQRRHA